MTELKQPKTLEDFESIKKTILELMGNPYCDQFMFLSLNDKLKKTESEIEILTTKL